MQMRKDFLITAIGIGGGQLVLFVFTPFLARTYTPDEFGVYAAIVALATVLASISSLRYDAAIAVVSEKSVASMAGLSILLPVLICPLLLGMLIICSQYIPAIMRVFSSGTEFLVGGIALLQGMVLSILALCARRGEFPLAAAMRMAQPVVFVAGALLVVGSLPIALGLSWLIALLLGVAILKSGSIHLGLNDMKAPALENWRFPVLFAPVSLLDNVTLTLPLLAIISVYGENQGGNYSQVQRLLGAPLLLLGMAVGQVFVKHAGDSLRRALPVWTVFRKALKSLFLSAAILLVLTYLAGEWALSLLLGPGWRTDTLFLVLVLLPILFRTCVSPLSSVFLLCKKLPLLASWQVSYFIAITIAVILGSKLDSLDAYLVALAIGELVMYAIYLGLAIMVVRRSDILQMRTGGNGKCV